MATGNLIKTVDILAESHKTEVTSVDELPLLVSALETNHKFATAKWLADFADRLMLYRDSEWDMFVNVNNNEEHLCETCRS